MVLWKLADHLSISESLSASCLPQKYQSDIIYLLVSDGEGNVMNANIMASKWLVLLRASVKPLSINVNFLDLTDPWESIECFQVFLKSLYLFLLANLNCFPGSY